MKSLRTLALCLFCLFSGLLFSQSFDYVTGFGFNTMPGQLVPLSGDRWLSVSVANPIPGAVFLDTVTAVIFNSNGEVLLEKHLQLPDSEVYRVKSAIATPDGGFAISVKRELCDASFDVGSLLVFDADGQLKWEKHLEHLPCLLKMSPDGTLVAVNEYGYNLVNFDLTNGDVISSFTFQDPGVFIYINDFEIINGRLVAIGYPNLQVWEKSDSTYYLYDSKKVFPFGSPYKMVRGSAGQYYIVNQYENTIYAYDPHSLFFLLIGTYPFQIIDFTSTASRLIVLAENDSYNFLVNIDFQGNLLDTIRTFPALLKATMLSYKDNTLSVAGINGSGPASAVIDAPWLPFNANQLWLHSNHLNAEPSLLPANAALTNVIQTAPIATDSFLSVETGEYKYYVSGGQYQVEVTNAGETLLESIDIHIGFNWNEDWICFYRTVQKAHYSGLGLLPGESVVLEFGDIQGYMPSPDACFWTSAPNHKPDAAPENDIFCKSTITVATNEPRETSFTITPNPANESLRVSFSEHSADTPWAMIDITGRQVKSGNTAAGMLTLDIDIRHLAPGMYIFRTENRSEKVLVNH